jgi:spore germination protein YaaH
VKRIAVGDTGARSSAVPGVMAARAASLAGLPFCKWGHMLRLLVLISVASLILLSGVPTSRAGSNESQTPPIARYEELNKGKPLAIGFYVDWDVRSYASLASHIQSLDWVVASWLYLRGERMDLKTSLNLEVLDMIQTEKPDMRMLAMIQNAASGEWDGVNLARFLADPISQRERISEIASFIETNHLHGIVIDFEQIIDAGQKDFISFVGEVHAAFKERGWLVAVAVPLDDPSYDYGAYAKACDYLILMGYDEHWSTGDPGPIASHNWFSTRIEARMRDVGPSQIIVAIGNYGYDWTSGLKGAQALTYPEAMQRARDMNATVELDPLSFNPTFFYHSDRRMHQVWFLNAEAAFYQLKAADSYRPAGYALWRLGAEDPAIWSILSHSYGALFHPTKSQD